MPATRVIKPKPVEATTKPVEKTKPVKTKAADAAGRELKAPTVRKGRASSCPRCPQRDRCERAGATGVQGPASKTRCERRARSTSAAPRPTAHCPRANPDQRRVPGSWKPAADHPKRRETAACPGPPEQRGHREQRGVGAAASYKAFTVIPPDPKRRREIQKKAAAELAALEELRLSRAMAYVSIDPSSVGGCMSLEEVRLKQQQEMMQAKRKPKPSFQMKKQVVEQMPVLTS